MLVWLMSIALEECFAFASRRDYVVSANINAMMLFGDFQCLSVPYL
ncbi:hypothetical protein SPWS13_4163 [Shewanella putrefaciens]|nr:hypothetical protein SPWS13_4163 [Shewanella putrefaciens]